MLRVLINGIENTASRTGYNVVSSAASVQSVRWRRKPRWLPVAKSKKFRVPERKKQPEDERLELLRLNNNYKTQMRSVRSYLIGEVERNKAISTAGHLIVSPEEEAQELERCRKINDEWNAEALKKREERNRKLAAEQKLKIAERLIAKEYRDAENLEKIEEIVRLEKERSKTYITAEKLDAAIEFALANPVDFNFAIDLKGNIYKGRTNLTVEEPEEKIKIQSN